MAKEEDEVEHPYKILGSTKAGDMSFPSSNFGAKTADVALVTIQEKPLSGFNDTCCCNVEKRMMADASHLG